MKHLVIVTDTWHPQINGVVTTLTETTSRLSARGWKVTVIHPYLFRRVPLPRYPQIEVAVNPWKMTELLRDLEPTHVHIAVEGPLGIAARFLCSRWNWRFTTAYHTNFPEYLRIHHGIPETITKSFIQHFHRKSSAVLVPSKSTIEKLSFYGIERTVLWGRGFDERVFYPRTEAVRREEKILLYVGRVSPEKNIEEFLRLKIPQTQLWVVGDGPIRSQLEKKYSEAKFFGFKTGTELADLYRSADVFVFPSRSDTLGVVMIESIACGTPVAAFDVEGPRDVVVNGRSGVLSSFLEEAVQGCLKLDREAVAAESKRFSWEKAVDTFEKSLVFIKC